MRVLRLSIFAVALIVVLLALAACGRKGDPIPPGAEPPADEDLF
jgi:predicted small lipoprotein YifL